MEKLLLHCCCAPCSSAIIEHLSNYYDITLYFYNPNITDEKEYKHRVSDIRFLLSEMCLDKKIDFICEPYNPEPFYEFAKDLKSSHEGCQRCKICYATRLRKTAEFASKNGFKQFSTTLTISPYKDSAVINSIGTSVTSLFPDVMYMPFDFGFLYTKSLDLCRDYKLYQQDYCGCEYSR